MSEELLPFVSGLLHASLGIFSYTGIINVCDDDIEFILIYVFLNVVPSLWAAKIFCIYWFEYKPLVASTSNFCKYKLFWPLCI